MRATHKPAAYDNDWLGNMNTGLPMAASWDNRFPVKCGSTPLDVARLAARERIPVGTVISLFNRVLGEMAYRVVAAPQDDRAGGLWVESVR